MNIHFKKDSLENPVYHLPRIQIVIDSDTLSMLFDTGAQAILSSEAETTLNQKGLVATSFINASTFEKWQKNHPDWVVTKNADLSFGQKSDMVLVPSVIIGNKTAGPVAFAKRGDSNFQVMSEILWTMK